MCHGQGHRIWAPGENPGDERRAYRCDLPPRQLPTRLRYGNSTRQFDKIRSYAIGRLGLFVAKRHKRSRRYGWGMVVHAAPDFMGLINLNGIVVAPRPNRPWRERSNAGGEGRR